MAVADKKMYGGVLASTEGTLYTAPSSTGNYAIVKSILICNTTAAQCAISIKLDDVKILGDYVVGANSTITISPIDQILDAGETIKGVAASANAVNVFISGKEVT